MHDYKNLICDKIFVQVKNIICKWSQLHELWEGWVGPNIIIQSCNDKLNMVQRRHVLM